MREISTILCVVECEEEQLSYLASIIETGCGVEGFSFESIPVSDAGDFRAYYKVVKE